MTKSSKIDNAELKKTFEFDDPRWSEADFVFKIHEFDEPQYFEILNSQREGKTFTTDHPIQSIVIEGDPIRATLHFGNFGHIHLKLDDLQKFMEGVQFIHEKMREQQSKAKSFDDLELK